MPDIVFDLIKSILLPGFIASLVLGWLVSRYRISGVALFLGFVAANFLTTPIPWFSDDSGLGVLLGVMLLSLLTIGFDQLNVVKAKSGLPGLLASSALMAVLSYFVFRVETPDVLHQVAGVAASLVCFFLLTMAETRLPRWMFFSLMTTLGLAMSLVMLHAHSARLGDIGFMWLACSSGLLIVNLFRPTTSHGVAGLVALLLPFLCYYGQQNTFSAVPLASFILLAASPLAMLFLALPDKVKYRAWFAGVAWLVMLLSAVVLAVANESLAL